MRISVIVPVYNVEKYLSRCLDSLVNQTFKDYEIIVVNDGSQDNSKKIINEYLKKFPELIKSYTKKNGGLGSARNYGLKKSIGEYIMFVDSDDFVETNMLEKMYSVARKKNSDMVICNINDYYEKSSINKLNYNIYTGNNVFKNPEIILNRPAAWNKLYKRELFNNSDMKFVDNKWYEDLRLTTKLYLECNKISFIKDHLYNYVIRENSIMNNKNISRNYEIIEAFEDVISYYREKNLIDKFNDEIEFLAINHLFIAASVRIIINSRNKDIRKNLTPILEYFKTNFNINNKNKYLKDLSFNQHLIYTLMKSECYVLIKFIFKIKEFISA